VLARDLGGRQVRAHAEAAKNATPTHAPPWLVDANEEVTDEWDGLDYRGDRLRRSCILSGPPVKG